ncbi:MAG: hypothetical protein WAV21_03555 [Minisyncoccia bacterium]
MSFFRRLFGNSHAESVVLIDIGSGSIGGAYAVLKEKNYPTICYTCRIPIRTSEPIPTIDDLSITLREVTRLLVTHGASELRRMTGSGSVGRAVVSVASPWQETTVRIARTERDKPFVFTRSLLNELVAKEAHLPSGRTSTGESVIATLLNGYEIQEPFNKRVRHAEVVILSENIVTEAVTIIETRVREAFHLHEVTLTAFAPLAYTVFRDVYPHENDYLMLDIAGAATDVALVKRHLLTSMASIPRGVGNLMQGFKKSMGEAPPRESSAANNIRLVLDVKPNAKFEAVRSEWITGLRDALRKMSNEQALPRTLFLLSDDSEREYLHHTLDDSALRSLWLSETPLSIIPVLPSHFAPYVKTSGSAHADVFLMLLALFLRKRIETLHA